MNGRQNLLLIVLAMLLSGCASMCDDSHDCDFHAYGGMRDRQDRVCGRVASVFDPAAANPSTAPVLEPLPPDLTSDEDLEDSDDGAADGDIEDSGLSDEIIDDLKNKTEELPEVPELPNGGGDNSTTEI